MEQHSQPVRVVDFDMKITSLITLFLKMSIAAIPAMILIWFFWMAVAVITMTVFGVGGALLGS